MCSSDLLTAVADAPDVASALAAPRDLAPVLPRFVMDEDDRAVLRLPTP